MGTLRRLPRWYLVCTALLFAGYLGGWLYTMHVASIQRAAGEQFIMPVGPHDSFSYAQLSESIQQAHFATPDERYETFHTPGYPAFVAAVRTIAFGSWFAVTFVQILLAFATAFMTYLLGRELVSERVGLFASLLFLANPLVPFIALYVLTDMLFTFLLTLGFLIVLTRFAKAPWQTAALAGLVFGAAMYVRPIGTLAIPILVAPFLVAALPWKKRIVGAIATLAIVGALMVPWILRNQAAEGVRSFSSLFSLNMAFYEIPHYWLWMEGLPLEQGYARVEKESGVPGGFDARGYPQNWYQLSAAPALDRYVVGVALRSPIRFGVWHLYNAMGGFFLNPAIEPAHLSVNLKKMLAQGRILEMLRESVTPWWYFLERLFVLGGLAFALWGLWRLRRRGFAWVFAFAILFFSALGGAAAESRLRLPVEPLLSIFIIVGIEGALALRRECVVDLA